MHLSLDGDEKTQTNFHNGYGNYGTFDNCSFIDIRVHDFPHYGFDPHHNPYAKTPTQHITIADSLSDHNGMDGLTTDTCNRSLFKNNILDANARHGINVCTGATSNEYRNNLITNNGANGIVIQPGGNLSTVSKEHIIKNNIISNNKVDGILILYSKKNEIKNNLINANGRYGIMLYSTSDNHLVANILQDNSQNKLPYYSGIFLSNDGVVNTTYNQISKNKLINSSSTIYKFGIAEFNNLSDYNKVTDNFFQNVKIPISLQGANSIRKDNIYTDT